MTPENNFEDATNEETLNLLRGMYYSIAEYKGVGIFYREGTIPTERYGIERMTDGNCYIFARDAADMCRITCLLPNDESTSEHAAKCEIDELSEQELNNCLSIAEFTAAVSGRPETTTYRFTFDEKHGVFSREPLPHYGQGKTHVLPLFQQGE